MARTNSTSGYRFAKSNFLTKNGISHVSAHNLSTNVPDSSLFLQSRLFQSHQLDGYFSELMESLRLCMNASLCLPISAQKRSWLVRNYWEAEILVKEIRLLLDPAVMQSLVEQHLQQQT